MAQVRLDHFVTCTTAENIDDYLEAYVAQGFVADERTVRHDPGLRNGFVHIGPEYVEFAWVEDETLLAAADPEDRLLFTTPRPCAIGLVADDVHAVHDDWIARGYTVPEVSSTAPRDAPPDTPPVWSFQEVPAELLPGVTAFVLTYHTRPRDKARPIQVSPNTVFAVAGVTFVTSEPQARATCWRDLLAPREQVKACGTGFHVWIPPHWATWMRPEDYQAVYGLSWVPSPHPVGELALLHLLASDLGVVERRLEGSGRRTFRVSVSGEEELLVAPDARDGFVFAIRQQPVETWLRERMGHTDEMLELVQE